MCKRTCPAARIKSSLTVVSYHMVNSFKLTKKPKNIFHHNFFLCSVSGLGFGIISGAFSIVNVLGDMTGPGTVGIYGDSQAFFLVTCKRFLLTLRISYSIIS